MVWAIFYCLNCDVFRETKMVDGYRCLHQRIHIYYWFSIVYCYLILVCHYVLIVVLVLAESFAAEALLLIVWMFDSKHNKPIPLDC